MKKSILGIVLLLTLHTNAQTIFEKFYHSSTNKTDENGMQMMPGTNGETWMSGMKNDTLVLRKADKSGNLIYTKMLKASWGNYLTATGDGFLFGWDSNGSSTYFAIVKIDTMGKMSWQLEFDTLGKVVSAKPTSDGGFMVATSNAGKYQMGCSITKFTAKNAVDWSIYYKEDGSGFNTFIGSYMETSDGFLVDHGGYTGGGVYEYYLTKLDNKGVPGWSATGSLNMSILETANSYICYNTRNRTTPTKHYCNLREISKSSGQTIWTKIVDSVDQDAFAQFEGRDMISLGNGYAILSYTDSAKGGTGRVNLIRTDTAGNTLSFKTFARGNADGLSHLGMRDSTILIFGTGNNGTAKSFYLIGTADQSTLYSGIRSIDASSQNIHVFPNPANGICNIQLSNAEGKTNIELYDLTGRLVMQNMNVTGKHFSMDLSGIHSGTYILKATNNNSASTIKVVKE